MKSKLRLCLSILAVYLFIEGLCFLCLFSVRKLRNLGYSPNMTHLSEAQKTDLKKFLNSFRSAGSLKHLKLDARLGWVPAPPDINSAGMRDDREYAAAPPEGVARLSAFGASYVYGQDVTVSENWTSQMAALAPSTEVLNYGVTFYGLDQTYLRYLRTGADYHPHAVLIGHTSDDLMRDVSVYSPFYVHASAWPFTKPRFEVRDGRLRLIPNFLATLVDYENFQRNDSTILEQLGRNDYYYKSNYMHGRFDFLPSVRLAKIFRTEIVKYVSQPFRSDGSYNPKSEAFDVTVRIFDACYRKTLDNGALPIVVIFPTDIDHDRKRHGSGRRYAPLLDYLREKKYRYLDLQEVLDAHESATPMKEIFTGTGHYVPRVQREMAQYILSRLAQWNLVSAAEFTSAARAELQRLGAGSN